MPPWPSRRETRYCPSISASIASDALVSMLDGVATIARSNESPMALSASSSLFGVSSSGSTAMRSLGVRRRVLHRGAELIFDALIALAQCRRAACELGVVEILVDVGERARDLFPLELAG